MSRAIPPNPRRHRHRHLGFLGVVLAGLAVMVVLAGSSLGTRVTNVANLDDGTCGRNLQIGSDKTASASPLPSFLLWGDGGLSSYRIFIDGVSIGTFNSDGFANVCIYTTHPACRTGRTC